MKLLGRDMLGRFIYKDDVLINMVDGSVSKADYFTCIFDPNAYLSVAIDQKNQYRYISKDMKVIVDLDQSPKRTNYDRYFADIGTIDEIKKAFKTNDLCFVSACRKSLCPFWNWGWEFDSDDGVDSCINFRDWLDEVAVL